MKYLIFFLLINSTLAAQNIDRNDKAGKPYIAAFSGGLDRIGNHNLDNWIVKNGGLASSNYAYNFGFRVLCPTSTNLMLGGGFNWLITTSPSRQDLYFTLLLGYLFKSNGINIIPAFEIGGVNSTVHFHKDIPAPLMKINASGGDLNDNAFLMKPNLTITKNFHPFMIGLELGCKIYSFSSTWKYYENGTNNSSVSVPQIPTNSFFHPYFSLLIGYDFGY